MRRPILAALLGLLPAAACAQQQILFAEVMYHPLAGKPEFIELWNVSGTPLDIAGARFTDGIEFQFPEFNGRASQAHFLQPRERIVLSAADAATTRAAYPSIPAAVRVLGPWSAATSLENKGERLTLRDKNQVILATLSYRNDGHWPVAADGTGHSLVLASENRPLDDWRNWRQSAYNGGSPGAADPQPPAAGLAINEFHFAPDTGRVDWVELRNNGPADAAATGLALASLPDLSNAAPLAGSLAPGDHASFPVDFPAEADGDLRLFLVDQVGRVLSAAKVRRAPGSDSWQAFPAAAGEWYRSPVATRDAPNDPPRATDVVINEIMADPPSNQRDGEFIELFNRGAAAVDLGGWKLDDAVEFTFPAGTTLPAGGYLVVAANRAHLNSAYPGLNAIGDWDGALRNEGELIRLLDQSGNLADEVDYRFGGEWPELAAGNGSSLELVNPDADNRFGSAWQDSDESQKSAFQAFTVNGGTYAKGANGSPSPNDDEIRIWAVGDAHVILRNIVLRPTGTTRNILVNPNVATLHDNNLDGWQSRGTHALSYSDTQGVHLIAESHGDNKCNHLEKDAAAMLAGTQYTLTFEARWVHGKPRLVTQTWDTSWGGTVRVPVPSNLGTPGARNSRHAADIPPQIGSLLHSPAVPTSAQTVTVTARVASTAPLQLVQVFHRKDNIDANGAWARTTMNDNGTDGDAAAGDGVWTAQIAPAAFGYNSAGNYVAEFYVRAATTSGAVATLPRAGAAAPGLWASDSQSSGTDLRRMRIVVSRYWIDALDQSSGTGGHTAKYNYKYPRLSNRYFPCTFVSDESEVYYGCGVRKTGSPWTRQSDGALTRGRVLLPGDKPFRGKTKLYWDNDAGSSLLHNRIARYWLYLFGVPGNQNEVCRVTRNQDPFAVRETSEVFDKEMLDRIWENGRDGQFLELDDKFWISDDGSSKPGSQDATWGYLGLDAQGYDNPTFYHNQFIPKSRETEYDYGGLIEWTKQLQNSNIRQEACERMADTRAMAAYAAVRGYIGDWDNLTVRRGKNGFMYQRAADSKWMLIHWDSDLAFRSTTESVLGSFAGVGTYFGRPFVRHYLNYYLTELLDAYSANGPRLQAWLTAEENASASYSANASTYTAWSTGRAATVQAFIGSSYPGTLTVSAPANNSSTSADTIAVSGTAPGGAFTVLCLNHPEATLTWGGSGGADPAGWTLAGLKLRSGTNTLTFRAYGLGGGQVGSGVIRTIIKTNAATPLLALATDPPSRNVQLGETVTFDATGSADPDGGALDFTWSVWPTEGVTTFAPAPGRFQASFSKPGIHTVTLQAQTAAGAAATLGREVLVCAARDFENFGSPLLPPGLTAERTELLGNDSPNSWYSLGNRPGNLVLQITDAAALPLNAALTFPRILRPLPAATDFALQTDFAFETRFFGNFFTGLLLETLENGQSVRYAFGVDAGTSLIARRATAGGGFSTLGSATFPGTDASGTGATLRIRRAGNLLQFQRLANGAWATVAAATMADGGTVAQGGIFAATGAAQSIRVAFDYLGVADPGTSSDLLHNLRLTEIMYHPADGGAEFIELRNIGDAPIDLGGAFFEDGMPFDRFVFPALTLAPGAYVVVTSDLAAFRARYGDRALVAGQFSGALNNAGERIVLKDADGNTILDFSYDDAPPWPTAADGGGSSLETRDHAMDSLVYGEAANWLASAETGGSPGWAGMTLDSDHDGQPDACEVAFGSDPRNPGNLGGLLAPVPVPGGGFLLAWSSVAGQTYTVEACDDLAGNDWRPLAEVAATGPACNFTDTTTTGAPSRWYRVRTELP